MTEGSGKNMGLTPKDLYEYLNKMGIEVTTVEHPPLFTIDDSQKLRGEIVGGHTKNLFLKDKKDNYFLVTVEDDAIVDLKSIQHVIGAASRVSFGKPEKLMEYLGVIPGSVTTFGVINDHEHKVQVILDAALMKHDIINCHPLTNEATSAITRDDLIAFLRSTGHEPRILPVAKIDALVTPEAETIS